MAAGDPSGEHEVGGGPAGLTVSIPGRFNGPLQSGNGGYSCGIVAARVEGTAEVSLRAPVPLDSPLELASGADGTVTLARGEQTIAEGRAIDGLSASAPEPVSVEEARRASERYRSPQDGLFSRCFVCGPAREDSLGVFAGPVEGRDLVASPWTPPEWAADDSGVVRPEIVWAVLDCPTYFAAYPGEEMPVSMLVRQAAEITGPIRAGAEHVVIAWPIAVDGRKREAGSAVLTAEGEVLAKARGLMVEPRQG